MNHTKRHILYPGKAARAAAAAILLCTGMPPQQTMADEYWDRKSSLSKSPICGEDIVMLGNSITDGGEFSELFGIHNIKPRHILGRDHRCRETPGSGSPPDIRLKYSCLSASTTCRTDTASPRSQSAYVPACKKIREQSPDTRLYIQSVMPIDNDYRRYKGLFGKENHQGFQCQGSKRSQRGTEPNTSTSG